MSWTATEIHVPSWRADVEHYSDIAEEVARFYGYNRIPSTLSAGVNPRRGFSPIQKAETASVLCAAPRATMRSSPIPSSAHLL